MITRRNVMTSSNNLSIARNPVGSYPGIYTRMNKAGIPVAAVNTGCRSCRKHKAKSTAEKEAIINTNSNISTKGRTKMPMSPEAAKYMRAKVARMQGTLNPQSGRLQTTPQTATLNTSNQMTEALKQSLKQSLIAKNHVPTSNNGNIPTRTNPVSPNQIVRPNANTRQHYTAPQLTDDNWDSMISNISQPICILFSTKHCGACRDFRATTWQEAYWTYKDRMALFEFDCGMNTKQDKEHDALSHPTIVFYHKGKEVGTYLGHSIFQYFRDYVDRLLDKLSKE